MHLLSQPGGRGRLPAFVFMFWCRARYSKSCRTQKSPSSPGRADRPLPLGEVWDQENKQLTIPPLKLRRAYPLPLRRASPKKSIRDLVGSPSPLLAGTPAVKLRLAGPESLAHNFKPEISWRYSVCIHRKPPRFAVTPRHFTNMRSRRARDKFKKNPRSLGPQSPELPDTFGVHTYRLTSISPRRLVPTGKKTPAPPAVLHGPVACRHWVSVW